MGCQVMYIIECENVIATNVMDWANPEQGENKAKEYERPSTIYIVN
jgi:hypothetical protein